MDWEGEKQHSYALVTLCFRDGDMEHYDEVIFSKPTFVNNDHIQLLNMMYSGVSSEPVDYRSQGGSPYEEYWQNGMNAVSIYNVKYLTANEYEVLSKFNVATFLGAESEEKKDWMGISLAGTVDEIFEMLSAEEARRNYKSCDACDSQNYLYVMEDETLCDDCITGMEKEWMKIFGRRPDIRGYANIDIRNPKYFPDEVTRQTVLPEFTRYDWYQQRQARWEGRLGWITLGALGWGLISAIWAGRDA